MQKELVDMQSKLTQQEREIKSLQGQLHDKKVQYETEVSKLKETIELMESKDAGDRRTAEDLKMEMAVREVKDRLEKLKWRNTSLSEENEDLRGRLIKAEKRVHEGSADGDRVVELQRDLERQAGVIRDLRAELSRLKSPPGRASPAPAGSTTMMTSNNSSGSKPPPAPTTPLHPQSSPAAANVVSPSSASPNTATALGSSSSSAASTPKRSGGGRKSPSIVMPSPRRFGSFLGRRKQPAE